MLDKTFWLFLHYLAVPALRAAGTLALAWLVVVGVVLLAMAI